MLISMHQTGPLATTGRIIQEIFLALGGTTVNLNANGFDEYFNPVSIPAGTLVWSCDPTIGSITQQGVFTALEDTVTDSSMLIQSDKRFSFSTINKNCIHNIRTFLQVILQPWQSSNR
ncbi:MAG: hypothetical protein MZV64_04215 [Ignavibacteriales bacterium]|nr:hypothetical protein [Ignavibacteriales bacterium]